MPVLERMRGPAIAIDLPGFGRSERPAPERFDYSMDAYGEFVWRLPRGDGDRRVLAVRPRLGRRRAARRPARPEPGPAPRRHRTAVPFLPGYRWHRTARIWRTPRARRALEQALDAAARWTWRCGSRAGTGAATTPEFVDMICDHLDAGTFDAILRLYRSARPERARARPARGLGAIDCPALVVWAGTRPLPAGALRPRLRRGAPERRADRAARGRPLALAGRSVGDPADRGVPRAER